MSVKSVLSTENISESSTTIPASKFLTMADEECSHISKVLPTEGDLFSPYVINCVVMSILSLTAIVGNVLILVSICKAPQFVRQPSYFLLVNLAFADFCVGFLAEPAYLVYKISYLLNPFSVLSCYAGITFNFLSYFLTSLSLWTGAVISLDRLLALHLHMKYNAIVTKFRVCFLIVVLLTLSSVFASMFNWALDAQNTVFVCADSIALLIALLSYVRIFQIVRYHQRQISIQLSEVSFAERGENDSRGSSCHREQDVKEQLRRDQSETVDAKVRDVPITEREKQGNGRDLKKESAVTGLQKKATMEHQENSISQEHLSVSRGVVVQQQMDISHLTASPENRVVQLVETTQRNSEITELSAVVSSPLEDQFTSAIINGQTRKIKSSEEEHESQSEPPVDNVELTMTETELVKIDSDQENQTFTDPQGETLVFEDKEAETISSEAMNESERFSRSLNLNCAKAEEATANVKQKTVHKEKSINDKNCFKGLDPNHDQNHVLAFESSARLERQKTYQVQNEAKSPEGNNCFKRCCQNYNLKSALTDDTALNFRRELHGREQMESSLSENENCRERRHHIQRQNKFSPDASSTPFERKEKCHGGDENIEMTETLEDNNYVKRFNQIQNLTCNLADHETAPSGSKETNRDKKNETTEVREVVLTRESELNNETASHNQGTSPTKRQRSTHGNSARVNENQAVSKRRKGFKMQHFKKSVFNMFVIWFLMLLCYLPLICTSLLVMFVGRGYSIHLAFNFTTSVMFVNSSINPIVFCWRIREFRAAVRKTLREVFGFWANQVNNHDNLTSLVN